MQKLIDQLATALVNKDLPQADRYNTEILSDLKSYSEAYHLAIRLKHAIKTMRYNPHDSGLYWKTKFEAELLVEELDDWKARKTKKGGK